MNKFDCLVEALDIRRQKVVDELEPEIRSQISLNLSDLPSKLTLDNLVGQVVSFELKNGEKFRGIVQKPRDFMTDTNALRIFTLDKPDIRIVPKKWIMKASVGKQEVEVAPTPKEYKVPGSTGNTYTVKHDGLGKWTCTCPAFKWKKGDCKHITAIKER